MFWVLYLKYKIINVGKYIENLVLVQNVKSHECYRRWRQFPKKINIELP